MYMLSTVNNVNQGINVNDWIPKDMGVIWGKFLGRGLGKLW